MDAIQIIFGWPSALLGMLLLGLGVLRKNHMLSVFGAIISSGFCLYTSTYPLPFGLLGMVSLIGNWLSFFAVRKKAFTVAAVALVPLLILEVRLGYIVLSQ